MIDLSQREVAEAPARDFHRAEREMRTAERSQNARPKTDHRTRVSQASTPQSRENEWLLAVIMCGWSIVLALPGNSLAGPAFAAFHRFPWLTETFWACLFGMVGGIRLVALYINGRSPRTPYGRMLGAFFGMVSWLQVGVLIAEGSMEQLGSIPPGIAVYIAFVVAEAGPFGVRAMMPDIPPLTDIAAAVGTGLAALIATLAMKRGEKDKKTLPAPNAETAGVMMGLLEKGIQQEILLHTQRTADGIEEIVDAVGKWIILDNLARQAAKERTTDHRLETVEANQADIKSLLRDIFRRMDEAETDRNRRHQER